MKISKIAMVFRIAMILQATTQASWAVSVTTWHNDLARTGVNAAETTLTTSNVNTGTFGKLYSLPVDGQIYAQPLYVPNVTISGSALHNGVHNVLYVATENNSLYAFDADSSTPEVLWQVNFGAPVPSDQDILTQIGILSTPVIDVNLNAIYVVAETYAFSNAAFSLHALDIRTGKDRVGSPMVISGSVAGTGNGSHGGTLVFNPNQNLQRPGLLELNGNIYVSFGSHSDRAPYNGWIFAYNNLTLRRLGVTCLSPNGYGGSVWQGGGGPAADASGNIYFATGNGDFNLAAGDYGDSVVKMNAASGLAVTSYFTPSAQAFFAEYDLDLDSGSVLIIPGSPLLVAPMVVAGGKDGTIYLLNSGTLGGYNPTDSVVQELSTGTSHFGGFVYYNNTLYGWGTGDVLRLYSFDGISFSPFASGSYQTVYSYANAPSMSLSANGLTAGTAILWAAHSQSSSDGGDYPGILHAYDAVTGTELWNSSLNSGDYPGAWSKWTPPTIANGKVYLATFDSGVAVYGLLGGN
jgi:hypothetical protein